MMNDSQKRYYLKHKEELIKKRVEYFKKKYHSDEEFRKKVLSTNIKNDKIRNNRKDKKNRYYTDEQIAYLKEIVPNYSPKEGAELFNKKFDKQITERQIINYRNIHNIKVNYKNPTAFKKGHIPANKKEENYEFINNGYVFKKVNNKFVLKHRQVYEEHNGKIPKGYNIVFLDRDTTNTNINNLALVSNKVHLLLARDDLKSNNKEITKTQVQIAELKSKANELKKKVI